MSSVPASAASRPNAPRTARPAASTIGSATVSRRPAAPPAPLACAGAGLEAAGPGFPAPSRRARSAAAALKLRPLGAGMEVAVAPAACHTSPGLRLGPSKSLVILR